MVTTILKNYASVKGPLDYNERKVARGVADRVACVRVDDSMSDIYWNILQIEDDPGIRPNGNAKNFGFHMAVNPGEGDSATEKDILAYIDELMTGIGYGEQPYVVYRHEDIERPHYHVISTRLKPDGSLVPDSFVRYRMMDIQRELAAKYGFTVGRAEKEDETLGRTGEELATVKRAEPLRFKPGGKNAVATMTEILDAALQYDFRSFYQFETVMRAYGLKVSDPSKTKTGNMYVQGLDADGKPCTKRYSFERDARIPGGRQYAAVLEGNKSHGRIMYDSKVRLIAVSDWCLANSRSEDEYCMMLDHLDVTFRVSRKDDEKSRSESQPRGPIQRVTLVERRSSTMVDTSVPGELFLKAFNNAETEGRWDAAKAYRGARKSRKADSRKPSIDGAGMEALLRYIDTRIEAWRGTGRDDVRRDDERAKTQGRSLSV